MTWKKALSIAVAVSAVALLAAVWWVSRYDFNRLKPIVVEQVRAATGREMTIAGDLHLKIGLFPSLVTGPVKLSNAPWGSQPDMVTVQTLELQISLPALLSKEVVLKRLVLTKPVVLVEEKADGRLNNWQFEAPPGQKPDAPQTGHGTYQVQLHEVDIQDGTLLFRNRTTGATPRLDIAKLALQKQGGTLPLRMTMAAAYDQKAFSLEGDISWLHDLFDSKKDWGFELDVKADQTDLSVAGRIHHPPDVKPPRIEARITGSQLDVRPWLTDASEAPPPAAHTNRVFPATPLPFDVLHDMDLQVALDVQKLLMPHMALDEVKAPIRIQGSRLEAGPARAKAGGGDYRAHLQIDARATPPAVTASLKIDQMNAEMMLKQLGLGDVIEGVLDVQAELESHGRSVAQLMAGLNGHAMLVSGEGRLGKLFFGLFDEGIADQLITLLNPLKKRSATTPIECLVIRFDSQDGLAELSRMIWVTPDSIVVGGGKIDLKTEKIDIGIQPTPKQGRISLGALTKPFRMGGTLGSPALRIDTTAAALTAGRIAGGLLFGPLGIAVAFTSIGTQAGNPCLAAVEAAEKGVAPQEKGFLKSVGDKLRFWKKD